MLNKLYNQYGGAAVNFQLSLAHVPFFGTSLNAVKTQIWIAMSVYVLVAILKKELKIERSLYEILQILSILLFEKVPMVQALTATGLRNPNSDLHKQLLLFEL